MKKLIIKWIIGLKNILYFYVVEFIFFNELLAIFKSLIKAPKKNNKSDVDTKICAKCYRALITKIKATNTI